MELIRLVMVRNRESISSLVSLRVLIVEARGRVERLMQVTDVMDKKTESIRSRSGVVSRVESVLDVVIHVGLLVTLSILTGQPVSDVVDSIYNVVVWDHI
jgi:hypothetical protein